MRTWERGVEGETLACGSGAMAVALWAVCEGAPSPVTVRTAGGDDLVVELAAAKGGQEQSCFGIARMGLQELRQQAFGLAQVSFQVFGLSLHQQAVGVFIRRRSASRFLGQKPGRGTNRDNPEP